MKGLLLRLIVPPPESVVLAPICRVPLGLLMVPALLMVPPSTVSWEPCNPSEFEAPNVSVPMVTPEPSNTGLLVVLLMITAAELLLGTVPGVQLPAVFQLLLTLPFQVCPNTGAEKDSAKIDKTASDRARDEFLIMNTKLLSQQNSFAFLRIVVEYTSEALLCESQFQ